MSILQRRLALIRRTVLGVLMVVPLFFAQGTQPQAALVYDESTDGDVTFAGTLMFSAGTSVVSGSSKFLVDPQDIDFDSFSYSVPTGFSLTAVTTSISNFQTCVSCSNEIETWTLFIGSPTEILTLASLPPSLSLFASALPLSAGFYIWDVAGRFDASDSSESPRGYSYDFTHSFVVSAVPLPAALPLFGSALALLGIVGWRRKRRAAA